ncbi:MAG: GMC family oxidoreductase N-terminal domain-containing protein, partial [Gammaproteobacteria bacterium]
VVTRAEGESVGLDGSQARSVSYWRHGSRHVMSANKEIILSAGSIGSPSILQRSGIGPSDVLERANVDMAHELSGVGENLTDHLEVYFQYR